MNIENTQSNDSHLPGISIATAEIWKLFQTTIPLLFKDTSSLKDEKHIEKLGIIIEKCKEHSDIYVPPNGLSVDQYSKQLPHYKAFTTWLLGQLVRVLCKKELESYFQSSVDSQITIMNLLAVNNIEMLIFVLREYFYTIQDLMQGRCMLLEAPTAINFKFERFSYKPDYEQHSQTLDLLEQMPFCVNNASTCSEVLISILFVIEKQIKWLTYSSSNNLNFVWSLVIKIVEDSDVSVVVAALDVLTTLIEHDGCTEIFLKFVNQLCTHIEPLVLYINMACKGDCSDNKNIMHLIKALCRLFGAISEKTLSRPELLSCLFHLMLSVLHKDNPFLVTGKLCLVCVGRQPCHISIPQFFVHIGCTVEKVCRFISAMNKVFPQDANIKKRVSPLLEELHKYPLVLYILEDIIFNEVRESLEKVQRESQTVANRNIRSLETVENIEEAKAIDLSVTYRDCWNCLMKCIEQLQLSQKNIFHISNFLKIFVEKIFILQYSLERKLKCKNVIFITSSFFDKFTELLVTSKVTAVHQKNVVDIVHICKYLLLMPDIGNIDTYVFRIVGFLSSPWLHILPPPDFLLSELETFKQLTGFISIEDKRCRLDALAYCTNRKTHEWRLQVLVSSLNNSLQCYTYEAVPLFINSVNHKYYVPVINQVLMPMDTSDFGTALRMTCVIPSIVCSILGNCKPIPQRPEPSSLPEQEASVDSLIEFRLTCTTCDETESLEVQENPYKMYIITLVKRYMNLREHMTPKVRQLFVLSLRRLSNHLDIFRTPSVFKQLLLLMDDGETRVRMALANTIVNLIFKMKLDTLNNSFIPICNNEESELLLEAFYQKTAQCIHSSLLLCSSDLQLSLISTVFSVGSVPLDVVLLPVLKLLTLYITHPSALNTAAAQTQLSRIAALHKTTVQKLFFRFQDELSKVVVTMFVHNYLINEKCFHNSVFTLANGFGFATAKDFLERTVTEYLLKYLVPWVIKKPNTLRLLDLLAEYNNSDVAAIIKNGFQYAYPHVLLFEDDAKLVAACDLFVSLSGINLRSLILLSIKMILCQLLLYYHRNTVRVKKALAEMKRMEFSLNNFSFSSDSEIADFIQPRFLGVLAFLDSKLVERAGCESVKKNVLLTLPDLIKLMGSVHITPVRFKVMATLRSALNLYHGFFPELICSAWRAFVQNVEPASLGPMLSTIFVSLLPLMEQFPVEIGSVFHILIIQNLADVTPNLPEIHFLEDTPAVHEVYTLVQKSLENVRELPIKEQLRSTLRSATHENADVRKHGLKKLREELSVHREAIYELITGKDCMDPLVIEILDILITGCRDSDEEIQVACGDCLGEIGAVDPGRLPNKVAINEEQKELVFEVDSDAFVKKALLELVRALQAAKHTITMDNFALCIQELLKIYEIPSARRDLWESLSDSTKEIITPLLCSRYVYINDASSEPRVPHPIFGSLHGMKLKDWAFNWACRLIPMVTETFPKAVFSVCRLGLKKNIHTLLFFLPYILLYAILSASQTDRDLIAEEILALLSWSEGKQNERGDNTGRGILTSTVVQIQLTDSDDVMTHTICVKTVYELFDFLYQWLRETKEKLGSKIKSSTPTQYDIVNDFLRRFSKLDVAEGSYACKDYTRSLMYLEEYVSEHPENLQKYLPSFGKIYSALNDPDSFRGIIAIHYTEPTAKEMILYHEVTGQLHDAAACYECLSQQNMDNEEFHKAMIRCYLSMDQPSTALQLAEGFLNRWTEHSTDLMSERAEAMWSMSMFNELEQYIKNSCDSSIHDSSWGVSLGRALLHLSNGREKAMMQEVNKMQQNLVKILSTTSVAQCGYRLGYDSIVKLHILNEFQKLGKMVLKMFTIRGVDTEGQLKNMFTRLIVEELDKRLKIIQPSCRVVQPVLCIRRVVLSLAQEMLSQNSPTVAELFSREIGKTWLKSIEIARKACNFQQAYTNIMTAERYKPKGLFIEKAKLLWAKVEPESALNTLKRGIEHNFPDAATFKTMPQDARKEDRRLCAEAKLLIAMYNDENVNVDMDLNLLNYLAAVKVCKDWEKSLVCLAQYQYRMLRTYGDNNDCNSKSLDCQAHMINYFATSLLYGCEYIYQSMPRMLSIWLDFGTRLAQDTKPGCNMANLSERRETLKTMISLIQKNLDRLPTYMFMTAFSQIISRICHPHMDCYQLLKKIIVKIIVAYPQQALWMFISVYKSPYVVRVRRCEEVLRSSEIRENSNLSRIINDFRELVDRLIELCHKPVKGRGGVKVSIKTLLPSLYRLVSGRNFSPILIPLQKYRTIALPTSMYNNHNPFPENMVFIAGMRDEVDVLTSLQKPKKFTFIGTDGKLYPMMCKPMDDLRLDARMMEFNSIVNMYLQRDPESRDRGLRIRTYSVVPLSDDSGLVEWLPNLYRMRIIIMKIYKIMGIDMQSKELKEICCARNDPLQKKRQVFLEVLLPRHPPVLKEWFLKEFPHPTAWYLARTAYVRTTAVMSIVGNTLGLGDRHGENILLDSTCGDVVHVDFNCLFNKGERFDWPERVPFRLTHNMVSAMGPTGVEGMFRHSCEITNRVMRQQIDQLMSVVRPFLYDPLVTWNSEKNTRDENAEMTNEKAMEDIQKIELRLQGILNTRNKSLSIPLSVEGQVESLIQEATNVDNLCQMYFGWGPFL